MRISFLLNGEEVQTHSPTGTETLLDYLRQERGLCGTKEGCNEGDCGACTVMVAEADGTTRALNSCILFLPQIHGRAVRTVEGLQDEAGELHPVQQAMIDHHGSQCGFCTPGFIMSMAVAHSQERTDFDEALAGNLCRCTGYGPIIRAAQEAHKSPPLPRLVDERGHDDGVQTEMRPTDLDSFASWYAENPDATLIAGGTDVGLWVTKDFAKLAKPVFLSGLKSLDHISEDETEMTIGAMTRVESLLVPMDRHYPSFARMLRRYGSTQVREAATLGGNIANGSPIGDSPPPLIALGAEITLRHGDQRRRIKLEDFFIEYGKQDRQPGEFVETIHVPKRAGTLYVAKISKRFDQDISALCAGLYTDLDDGVMRHVRLAYGGMAGTPKRATQTEALLEGRQVSEVSSDALRACLAQDFTPLSDMRASAAYRLDAAVGVIIRFLAEQQGLETDIHEVMA